MTDTTNKKYGWKPLHDNPEDGDITGIGGRPKGSKNKYCLEARDRFGELGFDVINEYVELYAECKKEIDNTPKLSPAKASLRGTQNAILKELMPYAHRKLPEGIEVENLGDTSLTIISHIPTPKKDTKDTKDSEEV